jgi:uncharacterized membrane protein YqjE
MLSILLSSARLAYLVVALITGRTHLEVMDLQAEKKVTGVGLLVMNVAHHPVMIAAHLLVKIAAHLLVMIVGYHPGTVGEREH